MKTVHATAPCLMHESSTHVTVTNANGDAIFHDDKRIPGVIEDARLIAATPELLEALRDIAEESVEAWTVERAKEAIAKATET